MLELLRRKAQSPFIQATVVIIALVFIFWGVGTGNKGGGGEVAVVNDTSIQYKDYQQAYEKLISMYREQLGGTLPEDLLKNLNLKGQVIDRMIRDILLQQGAKEMGLHVSNFEVTQAVQKMPAFQKNNSFNIAQYKAVLVNSRLTPATFEASIRSDLLSDKVMTSLARSTKISPTEINDRLTYDQERINLEYIRFSADNYKDKVESSDENLSSYFEKNKEQYKTAPKVKISYLVFRLNDALEKITIDASEIANFYQRNIEQFTLPERRSARHILFKVSENDSAKMRAEKKQQAEKALLLTRSGNNDFGELAKKYSEGPTGPNGGDLGWFSRGQMVKSFEDAVFSMQEGAISDLIETQFGFHIIKLEKIQAFEVKPLDKVKADIEKALQKNKAKGLTLATANKAYEEVILAGSLAKYDKISEIKISETDLFSKDAPPEGGEYSDYLKEPEFLNAAFALKKGELSSLIELQDGYAIIYADDKKVPEISPLADVKDRVRADFIQERSLEMAREAAKGLLAKAREIQKDGGDWFAELQKNNLNREETGFILRTADNTSAKGLPTTAVQTGFNLSAQAPFPEDIASSGATFFVYKFKEKKASAPELIEEKREEITRQLLDEKKAAIITYWLNNLRDRAAIKINKQYL